MAFRPRVFETRVYTSSTTPAGPRTHRARHSAAAMMAAASEIGIRFEKNGGADGDRTRGLHNAIVALSQLSYCPTSNRGSNITGLVGSVNDSADGCS